MKIFEMVPRLTVKKKTLTYSFALVKSEWSLRPVEENIYFHSIDLAARVGLTRYLQLVLTP